MQFIPADNIIPLASIPGYPEASQVEISKEVWPVVRTVVHTVTIALESGASLMASGFFWPAIWQGQLLTSPFCCFFMSEMQALEDSACGTTTVSPANLVRSVIRPSSPDWMTGRKPVIYLYPPSRLSDVNVELLLTSSWSFSAVYPLPQTAIPSGEYQIPAQWLTWAVEAEPDGRLVEKTTGVEVTYLYWEAT